MISEIDVDLFYTFWEPGINNICNNMLLSGNQFMFPVLIFTASATQVPLLPSFSLPWMGWGGD